ncbi:MAG: ParA family protein [Dehalococcoidia bacterium]|jgi:chromosome partitioning protein|nr:ParA family protein [Dehalococcoidia bacterium]
MSVVFAVTNQKGGVGKTTTTVSLATALAHRGHRVLIVDADPQANATSSAGSPEVATPPGGTIATPAGRADGASASDGSGGLYESLSGGRPVAELTVATATPGVSLIPSSPDLAGAEVELTAVIAREYRLKQALEPVRDRYDFVLIDCPPSLGLLTVNALAAADEVIIPVQTEYLALEGLGHLSQTVDLVRNSLNPSLRVRGIVLTMFDARTNLARQVEAEVREHFANTFHAVIPRSVRLSEAPSHGQPIQSYDPLSAGARAYEALADELLEQLQASTPGGSHGT